MASRYLELRNLVLIEPETSEFVQVTYLCDLDSRIDENDLLDNYGNLRNVGMATDKSFMALGLYPLSIFYERDGAIIRARENPIEGFELVENERNVYKPNTQSGVKLLCRMKYLKAA